MLNQLITDLEESGIEARLRPAPGELDGLLELYVDDRSHIFAVVTKKRPPTSADLGSLLEERQKAGRWGTPLLQAPRVPSAVARQLIPLGWSWADGLGNYDLRSYQFRFSRRDRQASPGQRHRESAALPSGPGATAIIRFLISEPLSVGFRVGDLASIAQVTPSRASQVLAQLRKMSLVRKADDGWIAEREALLTGFLGTYSGPGGTEEYFYTLDPLIEAAFDLAAEPLDSNHEERVVVSADIGPDLVAPWRRPDKLIVYAPRPLQRPPGFSHARDRQDANVIIRYPNDSSVFRFKRLEIEADGQVMPLADEAQMIWDLHDLGGDDRIEAAGNLQRWLLERND